MRTTVNGETWQLCKFEMGGGSETKLPIGVAIDRIHKPKNLLLQTDSHIIIGCSL